VTAEYDQYDLIGSFAPSSTWARNRLLASRICHSATLSNTHDAMNETPRLRSAYPSTPQSGLRPRVINDGLRRSFGAPNGSTYSPSPRTSPSVKQPVGQSNAPSKADTLIPLDVVDAPSQRAYLAGLYLALLAWKLSNYWQIQDELDSTWYFLKWVAIDMLFLFGVPALHIPWLEWSFFTTLTIFLIHFIADVFLMFQIPIPLIAGGAALLKIVYDRELSISDHRVDPADILHNSSIILGRQIIQILPEGSAILNPEKEAFCLDAHTTAVQIPIQINQTTPAFVELVRFDLDTYENDTITISSKQVRQMKRQADKLFPKSDKSNPRLLKYPVRKTGLYRLQRVVDESKLEVRRRNFDTLVAPCPGVTIATEKADKCKGDLSDIALNVTGVPPFKVTYSKKIKNQQSTSSVQTIQPPGLDSPLNLDQISGTLIDPRKINLDWARSLTVTVPINESLISDGAWSYTVEQVEDGSGNVVKYPTEQDEQKSSLVDIRQQRITVHNRPGMFFDGCSSEQAMQVAREDSVRMPLKMKSSGPLADADWPLHLVYTFAPEVADSIIPTIETETFDMNQDKKTPRFSRAGKYSLDTIYSRFCAGEISEPSSCIVTNPARPDVSLTKEELSDTCAGNTVGLKIDFDFTGTPPFNLRYSVSHDGKPEVKVTNFDGLRGQLEFRPTVAGSYVYEFLDIQDKFYRAISLEHKHLVLKQDLKPPASARFVSHLDTVHACLDQEVAVDVRLYGEPPWKLDYEIVQGGKRKKVSGNSDNALYSIMTPPLSSGGLQSLILTKVEDKSKCPESMRQELTIDVRRERPRAAFGDINGQRGVLALEGKPIRIPLRLNGNGPWTVEMINKDISSPPSIHTLRQANAVIDVYQPGTYELLSVHDTCPGVVDPTANMFKVQWIGRPALQISDSTVTRKDDTTFRKSDVCEGEDDALAISLSGNPPYTVKYEQKSQPLKGAASVSNKAPITAAIGSASIQMDTSKAGDYTYTFKELSDDRYTHSKKHFQPVTVRQKVQPLPSAKFTNPGKTYGYCKNSSPDTETETIPIILDGAPPFSLEISIAHHGSVRPEIVRLKDIPTNSLSWTLPRRTLDLGIHSVSIRAVKDSCGCARTIDQDPSSVRIMVSDPPTIIPLESQTDYCVGEHVSFSLSGQAPFAVFYTFQGRDRKATSSSTTFRRIADGAGEFVITGISDNASGKCKADKEIRKVVHPMPSVKISRGRESRVEIHEGGEVEILFEFGGTPPFEFTYVHPATLLSFIVL
jgi:nucleoporin POM152